MVRAAIRAKKRDLTGNSLYILPADAAGRGTEKQTTPPESAPYGVSGYYS
jgi:hypothetical protein